MRIFTPFSLSLVWCLAFAATSGLQAQVFVTNGDNNAIVLDGHEQRYALTPQSVNQVVIIQNLVLNQTYSIVASQDPSMALCAPDVTVLNPGAQVISYDPVAHQLRFVASASEMQFRLDFACAWDPASAPNQYLSLHCETCVKKKLKDIVQDMVVIDVSGGIPADDLIRDILIGGDCFDITGVTYTGQGGQVGTFSNGLTNVGFASGMIMATGDVSVAIGPNDQDGASAGYGIATPDADLGSLTGGATFDMADIEFDFTPTQSPLTFNFVFASEEYCEYVNTQFNDVFGFFISGPGFAGNQNIAVLPLTTTPVSINNVNHLTNSGYFTNNTPAGGTLCGQTGSFAPATQELQFDGLTKQMVATAPVQVCQTYHIKLKIADVGDGIFDSAVFLKAGSFDAGGNASVHWEVNGDPDADEVFEGCGGAKLVFTRFGTNLNTPMAVQYTVTGTATSGLDYSPIPSVVIIPSGQSMVSINVNILTDALLEGQESVIITLNNPCSCLHPQEILLINDLPVLNAIPDTVTICGPGIGTISINTITGVEPYTYHWANGFTTPTISVFTTTSTNYKVTVTDACGKTFVATARIIVNPPPSGQLLGPAPQLCPGQDAVLHINFNGTGPFTINYTLNGNAYSLTDIVDDPYDLVINEPGLYVLNGVVDGSGCPGVGQGTLLVLTSALNLTGVVNNVTCNGGSNGSINTTVTGGQGPYTYNWMGPTTVANIPDPLGLKAGTYSVTVTDGFGCNNMQQFVVNQPTAILPAVAGTQGPNCINPNGGSIDLSVSGGTPNYTYLWNIGQTVQDPQGLTIGTYTVTVTDQAGCTKTTTATVTGNFVPPTAAATVVGMITCTVPVLTLDGSGSSSGPGFIYNWTANPGTITSGAGTLSPTVSAAGTYTLVVTNQANGCTASAPVSVTANSALPTANAGPNQTLTCILNNITLDGSGSSQGGSFTYDWTATQGGVITGGGTTLNPIATTPGLYTLVVTNQNNGCTQTDNAVISSNTTPPSAVIANPALLTCVNTTVTLNGGGSTPAANLTYQWTTTNGAIASGQTSANAVVSEPGQYTLIVTNTLNGCTDSKVVTVNQDNSVPTANAAVTTGLDCNTTSVAINGGGSSTGANFSLSWTSTPGGVFQSGQTTLNPVVTAPATYTLLITNLTNNCTATASVLVGQDIQAPVANAGAPNTLNCTTTLLTLGDPNAATGPNLIYAWTGTGITGGANTPTPTANQPGPYNLVVTNTTNGCTSTASVTIAQNITNPTAIVAPGGQLTCAIPALQLSGAGSSAGPTFVYDWTSSSGGGIGSGGTTLTPTVTAAGTYTLLVTNNANGCTSTASTTVVTNANVPTALATPDGILTCADQQVVLDATGSTTGSGFTYQWGTIGGQILSGQGTLQATVGLPGPYTLIVTNTANNCTATFNVDVNADVAPPVADAGPAQTLDCTVPSLSLNGSSSSTGPNFIYQWTAVSGGNFITPTNIVNPGVDQAGTYQIEVTNTTNGCTSIANVQIIADANDPVVAIATPAILNCTTAQTVLDGSGSSSGANFNYAWNGQNIVNGVNTPNATVNQPGDYTLVITNTTNGCTTEKTVTVAQDIAPPPVDAGPDNILNCYTPQQQLGGPGNPSGPNYTFLWNGSGIVSGGTTPSPIINQGGIFTVTVTNTVNGCTSSQDVNIATDFAAPMADAGPGFVLTCVQNNYTLSAVASQGPNFVYHWTTNTGSFQDSIDILNPTVTGSGDYFLLVTNTSNGCTASSTVIIGQAADVPVAVALNAPTLTCAVTSVPLSGTGSSTGTEFSYLWTPSVGGNIVNGNTTLNPTVNQPGTYTLAVTNTTNNCTNSSSVIVSEDVTPPNIDPGQPQVLTCNAPTAVLTGTVNSNGSFTYQWQAQGGGNIVSGGTTLTPTVNATGTYDLVVTSQQNGCTSLETVAVSANQTPPNAVIGTPGTLTCVIQELPLDATGSSTGAMNYAWTTAGGHFADLSVPLQPVVDQPGSYTLLITDTGNGCTQSTTINVGEDIQNPTAAAGSDGLLNCAVTSLLLDGTASSQTGSYFYQWTTSGGGQILVGANSLTPTIVAGGTYTLVVVNNVNGCTSSDNTFVDVNTTPPIAAIASPAIITCVQPQVILNGNGSQGGPGISYAWTTNVGNIVSGGTTNQAVVNTSGVYELTVLNSVNGCSNTASATVSDNVVLPVADAGAPFTLTCSVLQVSLQGSGSNGTIYTYAWSTANGHISAGQNTLTPVIDQEGTYQLVVTNTSTGCTNTDDVPVYRETNVPTDLLVDVAKPSCKDNDGVITFGQITGGYGPYLYSIDNGHSYFPAADFAGISPGSYDLWIQDVNGCEYHEQLNVPKAPDPAISIAPEFHIVLGDSLELQAVLPSGYPLSLIDTVIWKPVTGLTFEGTDIFSLLHPTAKPFKPTEYTVTVVSGDGCEASDRVLIDVDNEPHIYIPNVFSPWDANNQNDIVYIFADGNQVVQINKFQIFDRWGEMVYTASNFQPNDPAYGWDGRLGGKMQTPAVFVYYAEVQMIDGRVILFKGDVTLLR